MTSGPVPRAIVASAIVGSLVFGSLVLWVSVHGGALAAPASAPPTVYRSLTIGFDPATGTYDYSPTQLSVPLGARVVFTIENRDPAAVQQPPIVASRVLGVEGGSIQLVRAGQVATVSGVPWNAVSHTFTIDEANLQLNVPIPPAAGPMSPCWVTFTVLFPAAGTYAWGCVVLCGGPGMMDVMSGYLTVT